MGLAIGISQTIGFGKSTVGNGSNTGYFITSDGNKFKTVDNEYFKTIN